MKASSILPGILILLGFILVSCSSSPDTLTQARLDELEKKAARLPQVTFEWFNLTTNQIWVIEVIGLPQEAQAGRLMPSHAEDQLEVAASVFSETVRVKDRIRIEWKEAGAQGWQGDPNLAGFPQGVSHYAEFKRADLGIPAKLTHGKVRFTYLGGEKWRVKMYGPETTFKGTNKVKDFSPPYSP